MFKIHREGHLYILSAFVLVIAIPAVFGWFELTAGVWVSRIILLIILGLVVNFFRVPNRNLTINPNQLIAPADGKVVVIEEVFEPEFLKTRCRQISIFMNPVDVHHNLMPIEGTITYFKYHPGKYLAAWLPKSSTENERTTVAFKTADGRQILMRQIAGALARRIMTYVKEGQFFNQNQEFGFIKFGSRVDIYIPLECKVLVSLEDRTVSGVTPIVEWTT